MHAAMLHVHDLVCVQADLFSSIVSRSRRPLQPKLRLKTVKCSLVVGKMPSNSRKSRFVTGCVLCVNIILITCSDHELEPYSGQ